MDSIILALNGEPVPLKNIRISLDMDMTDKDQSGQSSGTTASEQGTKAKELRISGIIPFTEIDKLKRIYQLAGATQKGGAKLVYRVANNMARAVNLREVVFSGKISTSESDGMQAWTVSFALREYISVPEKKQARTNAKAQSKVQKPGGKTENTPEPKEELSSFEQVMKWIDSKLAPDEEDTKSK